MKMTRRDLLANVGGTAAIACLSSTMASAEALKSKAKRGVSFYSYQEEYYARSMTLEDCLEEMASVGRSASN
jgi:hypothetical protein